MLFHAAQAAVRPAGQGHAGTIEVDICSYEDLDILSALSLSQILGREQPLPSTAHLLRVVLPIPGDQGRPRLEELCDPTSLGGFADFPRVAARSASDPAARDIFVACARGATTASNCVARVDTATREVCTWAGAVGKGEELVGEPLVVSPPGGTSASSDVVLVGTHDVRGSSLVVLDTKGMVE